MTDTLGFLEEEPETDTLWSQGEFDKGREKRVSLVLLLDTSSSMAPEGMTGTRPIDELNNGLVEWAEEIRNDEELKKRVELAIVTFGRGGVSVQTGSEGNPFEPVALFEPQTLTAGGVTPMLAAIDKAIDLTQTRKSELDRMNIRRFRPYIFMLTDGAPTDHQGQQESPDAIRASAREIAALEDDKALAFFAVGVRNADATILRQLAPPRGYWNLGKGRITDFLKLASTSAGKSDPIAFARAEFARLGETTS